MMFGAASGLIEGEGQANAIAFGQRHGASLDKETEAVSSQGRKALWYYFNKK